MAASGARTQPLLLDALTYGTAWARVEAGFHFPSDTLVGISLGNFNEAFFNDAFLGLEPQSSRLVFSVAPLPRGAQCECGSVSDIGVQHEVD